uniref:Uncharacterized protein n=1 Tax=Rhizophora mucronata TaxID=61149 RepID=A0A2P2PVU9_RHIMU
MCLPFRGKSCAHWKPHNYIVKIIIILCCHIGANQLPHTDTFQPSFYLFD